MAMKEGEKRKGVGSLLLSVAKFVSPPAISKSIEVLEQIVSAKKEVKSTDQDTKVLINDLLSYPIVQELLLKVGDINKDGVVNIKDLDALLKFKGRELFLKLIPLILLLALVLVLILI